MSAVNGYKFGDMPRFDFENISNRPACLNIAQDAVDLADENRVIAKSFTHLTLGALVCCAVEAAISTALFMTPAAIVTAAVAEYVFLALCGLQLLTVSVVIYCLWKRGSYSTIANNFDMQSMVANARAAELPPWSGTGLLTGLFIRFFSLGNGVTKIGAGSIGGQTVQQPNWVSPRTTVRY